MKKVKVTFYGCCDFAGVDMDEITEMVDIDSINLDQMVEDYANEWAGVEGWYEVHE